MMHKKSFKCPVDGCGSSFGRNSDLQRHDNSVHKHELRFWCEDPDCDAGFARKDHLTQHMSKHQTLARPSLGLKISEEQGNMQVFERRKRRRSDSSEADNEHLSSSDDEPRAKKLKVENARLQELVNKQAERICALTSKTVAR